MGTAAGLDSQNAVLRQCASSGEKFGIFFRKNIVCHDRQTESITQRSTECFHQGSFAGSDRPADSDHRNLL
jgi:hypothetical protein